MNSSANARCNPILKKMRFGGKGLGRRLWEYFERDRGNGGLGKKWGFWI